YTPTSTAHAILLAGPLNFRTQRKVTLLCLSLPGRERYGPLLTIKAWEPACTMPPIGFYNRLLEDGTATQRYNWALQQVRQAERYGFSTAWIAKHHFDADEGGLPPPWPLLGAAAQATQHIRLGTAVVTLPHENAVRTAEDAAVVDIIS